MAACRYGKSRTQFTSATVGLMLKCANGSIGDYIVDAPVPNLDSAGLLSGFGVTVLGIRLLDNFFRLCDFSGERRTSDESRALTKLRDTLFPNLLSG